MLKIKRYFLLLALAAATAGSAQAQTPPEPPGETTVIVIGERRKLLRIPGSGQTIENEDLTRARVFTVNEALRAVPGVFPRDEEGFGLRPNIGIRGLLPTRSTKVLLLEDGLPLSFAPYGDNASYYHPPVGRFARIEILKGASQVRFGPQTIGGVVNYITPRAPETAQGRITVSGGEQGTLEIDATGGGPVLGGRSLLHLNMKQSDGSRENQALSYNDVYWKGEWDFGAAHALTLRVSRFAEDSQVTYTGLTSAEFAANPRGNPFVNDSFITERWGASATYRWDLTETLELKTSAYYSYFTRDWWRQSSNSGQRPNDASDPLCGGMANLNTTCGNEGRLRDYYSWGVETRLGVDHALMGFSGRTEIGLRYHDERQDRSQWNGDTPTARSPGTSVNGGVREDNLRLTRAWSAWIQSSFVFDRLTIDPGVRFEWINFERQNRLNLTRGESDLSVVVPGIGATFALNDELVLFAGVHKGFAPPRVEDIISATGGSVDLEAEESVNWEFGLRGALTAGLLVDLAYFHMDFSNQIVPASVAGGVGAALTSAGATRHEGAELLMSFSVKDAGLMDRDDIFARLSLTSVWQAEFASERFSNVPGFGAVRVTGNRLPYAPEFMASVMAGFAWDETLTFQAELVHTGAMFTDDLNTVPVEPNGQRGEINSATILNVTLNITPADVPWSAFITVKNATDTLYVVDRSRGILPGPGRLTMAGISLAF